jgi:hypothetical protein
LLLSHQCRPTPAGAGANPCALNHRVALAVMQVIEAGLASAGGWARRLVRENPITVEW